MTGGQIQESSTLHWRTIFILLYGDSVSDIYWRLTVAISFRVDHLGYMNC